MADSSVIFLVPPARGGARGGCGAQATDTLPGPFPQISRENIPAGLESPKASRRSESWTPLEHPLHFRPLPTMLNPPELVRERLREIERAFTAFKRGDRNRLYETRDSLVGLTSALEESEVNEFSPLSEIASRVLGLVIMEGGLTEARSVEVVREILGFIEAQIMQTQPAESPGGVFHIVNSEKVGDLLVRRGLIKPEMVHKALLLQRVSKGRRFGQVLVAMNAIDQRTLDEALQSQKDETRRAETRRASPGTQSHHGTQTLPLASMSGSAPIPPMPPLPSPQAEAGPVLPPASPAPEPGLKAPGLNAPRLYSDAPVTKLGLDWLDGK
ncbi:MAG: hypothetical protein ACI8WY_003201 [Planctomycetota bacterium]|jgi:hypothetical protein